MPRPAHHSLIGTQHTYFPSARSGWVLPISVSRRRALPMARFGGTPFGQTRLQLFFGNDPALGEQITKAEFFLGSHNADNDTLANKRLDACFTIAGTQDAGFTFVAQQLEDTG